MPDMRAADLIEQERHTDDHQTWDYHSWVSTAFRCICVAVPKNACTTVKRTLLRLDDPAAYERLSGPGEVHHGDVGVRLKAFDTDTIATMLRSEDWLRFAFVRNPYSRMFSAYKSKIANTWDYQYAWIRDEIRAAFGYPQPRDVHAETVAFADFVRFVASRTDSLVRLDGHINTQHNILRHRCIPYDVLGRFESLSSDFEAILWRLGAPEPVRKLAAEVTNSTPPTPLPYVYDGELADLVFRMYQEDFDAYGYRRDSWRTP